MGVNNAHPSLLRQIADELERNASSLEKRALWSRKRVAEYLDIGLDKLDAFRAMPDFPRPLTLGGEARMLRWVPDEVEVWALSRRALS